MEHLAIRRITAYCAHCSNTAPAKAGEGILMEAGYWPPIARVGRYILLENKNE